MQTWHEAIGEEKQQPYFKKMMHQIQQERHQGQIIYPPENAVFNAFKLTEFSQVKLVILGQDPYHGENQAYGLAFSVQKNQAIPPSLQNIYKELALEYPNFIIPNHGCLDAWATQGVLLLNTVLTVKQGQAHSHAHIGWEIFTDKVIHQLNKHKEHLVFLLWGAHAQKKGLNINRDKHLVLTAPHPSPLSSYRGFFGCNHFVKANDDLIANNMLPIDWQIK